MIKLFKLIKNLHLSRARVALLTALVVLIGAVISELLLPTTTSTKIDALTINAGQHSAAALASSSENRSEYLLSLDTGISFQGVEEGLDCRFAPINKLPAIEPGKSIKVWLESSEDQAPITDNSSDIKHEYAAIASSRRVSLSYDIVAAQELGEDISKVCARLDKFERNSYTVLKHTINE